MSTPLKSQAEILAKLGIQQLNPMQVAAQKAIDSSSEIILLSPTGTGKTLAFLLPLIQGLDATLEEIQIVIIVPSRELAIQIEQVMREMGTGYKVNAVYGGRTGSKDRIEIKHRPAVLVGTPGRVADHLRRVAFDTAHIRTLVLDEFDKSLEIGFESEMKDILHFLPKVKKILLTSATQGVEIPGFVRLKNPTIVDFLEEKITQLQVKKVLSPTKDKQDTLLALLGHLAGQNGIIFCNFKDSIEVNVNCINVYFNIGYTINRQRFYEYLIDLNFMCKYKPESYSGIKFIYKIPIQSFTKDPLELNQNCENGGQMLIKDGICTCSSKCTCSNITFLIFQSGNVIATGFKTIEQIKNTTFEFNNICNNAKHIIQKRTFT